MTTAHDDSVVSQEFAAGFRSAFAIVATIVRTGRIPADAIPDLCPSEDALTCRHDVCKAFFAAVHLSITVAARGADSVAISAEAEAWARAHPGIAQDLEDVIE